MRMSNANLEALIARATRGDEAAWRELGHVLEESLDAVLGDRHFLGRVVPRLADRRTIIREVLHRLREDELHRLELFVETRRTNPKLELATWLRVVAKRVVLEHPRGSPPPEPVESDGSKE